MKIASPKHLTVAFNTHTHTHTCTHTHAQLEVTEPGNSQTQFITQITINEHLIPCLFDAHLTHWNSLGDFDFWRTERSEKQYFHDWHNKRNKKSVHTGERKRKKEQMYFTNGENKRILTSGITRNSAYWHNKKKKIFTTEETKRERWSLE